MMMLGCLRPILALALGTQLLRSGPLRFCLSHSNPLHIYIQPTWSAVGRPTLAPALGMVTMTPPPRSFVLPPPFPKEAPLHRFLSRSDPLHIHSQLTWSAVGKPTLAPALGMVIMVLPLRSVFPSPPPPLHRFLSFSDHLHIYLQLTWSAVGKPTLAPALGMATMTPPPRSFVLPPPFPKEAPLHRFLSRSDPLHIHSQLTWLAVGKPTLAPTLGMVIVVLPLRSVFPSPPPPLHRFLSSSDYLRIYLQLTWSAVGKPTLAPALNTA